jgi:TRAP-type C4-dicarboxylate transport system permease small subunit
MVENAVDTEVSDSAKLEAQYALLPPPWRLVDRSIIRVTELCLFVVGLVFALMVTLEVISRYVFNFSIFFVDGAAKLLLLWFFLLGAGIALRYGAHVGFELLINALNPKVKLTVLVAGQCLALLFFLQMVWGGLFYLEPASLQSEPTLNVSLFWAFLAVPVGFSLLSYHMIVVIYLEIRRASGARA